MEDIIGIIEEIDNNNITIDSIKYKVKQTKKLKDVGLSFDSFNVGYKVKIEKCTSDEGAFSVVEIIDVKKKYISMKNEAKKKRPVLSFEKRKLEIPGFSYPYNFVSLTSGGKRSPLTSGNNSGKITCTLKNLTPIFIGGNKIVDNKHTKESFIKNENDNYIIPASSLKGAFRSVLEAISNSCYSQIENERLEERKSAGSFKFKYGIITKLPTSDECGEIEECEKAKIGTKIYRRSDYSNIYSISLKELEDINYIIEQRKDREKRTGKEFYLDKIGLNDVILFENDEDNNAKHLAFSQIPRLRCKNSPYDFLPEEFTACEHLENLCYACRIFGMVGNTKKSISNDEEKESLGGKVYFSDAINDNGTFPNGSFYKLIKPLGTPHPSLTNFYLESGNYDENDILIRGRKFYWHHTDKIDKTFDQIQHLISDDKESPSNSSLQIMETGNVFKFEVHFKNITEDELGLLLYSLQLEDDLLHKIGRGKSLGLGSCKVIIDSCEIENKVNKYSNWSHQEVKKLSSDDIQLMIGIFKTETKLLESINYKELKNILKKGNKLDFSKVAFPVAKGKLPGENTVNWFMNKKEKGKYPDTFKLLHILDYTLNKE